MFWKRTIIIFTLFTILVSPLLILPVFAQVNKKDKAGCITQKDGITTCPLPNPLKGDPKDVKVIVGKALKGVLALIGAVTLVMFVYGGFSWLVSAGDPDKIKTGRDTMVWAAIGMVTVFASYNILNYVLKFIVTGT